MVLQLRFPFSVVAKSPCWKMFKALIGGWVLKCLNSKTLCIIPEQKPRLHKHEAMTLDPIRSSPYGHWHVFATVFIVGAFLYLGLLSLWGWYLSAPSLHSSNQGLVALFSFAQVIWKWVELKTWAGWSPEQWLLISLGEKAPVLPIIPSYF